MISREIFENAKFIEQLVKIVQHFEIDFDIKM